MRKAVINISFVLFSCFFVLFATFIATVLSPEPSLYDLYLSEGETYAFEIRSNTSTEPKTYGELYDFLTKTERVKLLKKTSATAVNEIILYAPEGFRKKNRLSELCDELNSGKTLLLNTSHKRFLTDGKLLLEGQLRETEGYFTAPSSNDYPCVADMSIFRDSEKVIDYDTFYIQYNGSFSELSERVQEFFCGNYEVAVSAAESASGFESADLMLLVGSVLAVAALSFNLSVFVKLWLSENRKVFFCKFLCGCDITRIRKEAFAEFASNLAIGSAAALALFLLLRLTVPVFRFELSGFATACVVCNALFAVVYLLTARREFPKSDSLCFRRAN